MSPYVLLLLLGTLTAFVTSQTVDDCPEEIPRDKYLQVHDGYCFNFKLYEVREYNAAEESCQAMGGTLPVVKSEELQDYLVDYILYNLTYRGSHDVWIGLTDKAEENTFVWADGTPLSYSNWESGEGPASDYVPPAKSNLTDFTAIINNALTDEDCVSMDPHMQGIWRVTKCTNIIWSMFGIIANPYICQYKI